jgi:hypothetical protein
MNLDLSQRPRLKVNVVLLSIIEDDSQKEKFKAFLAANSYSVAELEQWEDCEMNNKLEEKRGADFFSSFFFLF